MHKIEIIEEDGSERYSAALPTELFLLPEEVGLEPTTSRLKVEVTLPSASMIVRRPRVSTRRPSCVYIRLFSEQRTWRKYYDGS